MLRTDTFITAKYPQFLGSQAEVDKVKVRNQLEREVLQSFDHFHLLP